jgi:hypothetical protein
MVPDNDAKICPLCGGRLQLYETPMKVMRPNDSYLWGEPLFWLVAVAAYLLTWRLGNISYAIAALVGVVAIVALFRKFWRRSRRDVVSKYGRYRCESCHHHFEGDALHQLTSLNRSEDPS